MSTTVPTTPVAAAPVISRGSDKLIAGLAQKGLTATPQDVIAALAVPSSLSLLRWHPRGIPPVYFEIEAAFQVKRADLAAAVASFSAHNGLKGIKILTNGIPAVYDTAEIQVVIAGN
jgi:hypothetical protein